MNGDEAYANEHYQGSKILDDYLARDFAVVARFCGYEVLRRLVER